MKPKCIHSETTYRYGIWFCKSCGHIVSGDTSKLTEEQRETLQIRKERQDVTYGEFKPYELNNGPIQKICGHLAGKDPNYIVAKDGSGCDSINISSKSEEAKYFKMMDIRNPERGEMVYGIKAELKDRPAKRVYSFGSKSVSSE